MHQIAVLRSWMDGGVYDLVLGQGQDRGFDD